jgi:hypothetical protein
MKKITQLLFFALTLTFFISCDEETPEATGINYVAFEATTYTFGVDIGSSNTRSISIYAATTSSSARSFTVNVVAAGTTADPASYTIPTTVDIPAGSNVGTLEITISDTNISSSGETIELGFASADGLFTGNNITLNVRQVCPTNPIELEITFDNYSGETSWELLDGTNTVIASNSYGSGETSDAANWCVPNDTYTFIIYDAYGDGICCSYGNGSYVLRKEDGTVLASGGSFGASESTTFTLP